MATAKQENKQPEPTMFDRLAEAFPPHCIEWLPKKILPPRGETDRNGRGVGRALALCYIDARSVMARLDEVCGPGGWQDSYRWEGNRTICRLSLLVDGQWIAKEDGSGDTHVEAEKGGVSGAFKRAAVKWGIGRYLYDVDEVWADCNVRVVKSRNERDKPKVYHDSWTEDGEAMLAAALNKAPGPRETGKPFPVTAMLDLIDKAESVGDLRKAHDQHWPAIPLEYRAEVLRALDTRADQIEATENRDGPGDGERSEG